MCFFFGIYRIIYCWKKFKDFFFKYYYNICLCFCKRKDDIVDLENFLIFMGVVGMVGVVRIVIRC